MSDNKIVTVSFICQEFAVYLSPSSYFQSPRSLLSLQCPCTKYVGHLVVSDFATPWIGTCQAPLSMGFSRQEYCSRLPFPSPEGLPDRGIKLGSPTLQADSLQSEPLGKTYKQTSVPCKQNIVVFIQPQYFGFSTEAYGLFKFNVITLFSICPSTFLFLVSSLLCTFVLNAFIISIPYHLLVLL